MKNALIAIIVVLLGVVVYLFVKLDEAKNIAPVAGDADGEGEICIQVITPAKNPETGEVVDFPTPCDVPEGWEIVRAEALE